MTHRPLLILAATSFALTGLSVSPAEANNGLRINKRPALVITDNPSAAPSAPRAPFAAAQSPVRMTPPPADGIAAKAASITPSARPYRTEEITAAQLSGSAYYDGQTTLVGRKIADMMGDLGALQSRVGALDSRLTEIERRNDGHSAEYYAAIATISTQLQAGTTPGNPRLVQRLSTAQSVLDTLGNNVADLNGLAVEIASAASQAAFLMEATQATYSLSGAVEEDHQKLSGLEDQINESIARIDRLLNDVNDDITRTAAYLSSERANMRTLSLAVSNGDMYGRALSNRPFANAGPSASSGMMQPASFGGGFNGGGDFGGGAPASSRPLVRIKFDKPNVQFEQPVYMAVNEAMEKYPQARFEIVAVHPTGGNAAQVAIEGTRARRNAEQVLRSLTQMGLDGNRIDVSYAPNESAATSEVHINIVR